MRNTEQNEVDSEREPRKEKFQHNWFVEAYMANIYSGDWGESNTRQSNPVQHLEGHLSLCPVHKCCYNFHYWGCLLISGSIL